MSERHEIHFRGHVQGVGFRYTAANIARGYAVAGYVRNLADGRVQLVVEGERDEVARYVGELTETMRTNIRETTVDVRPANGEFTEFEIRH